MVGHDGIVETFPHAARGRSADGTAFLLGGEAVMRAPGERITVNLLLILRSGVSRADVISTLKSSPGKVAIGASSRSEGSVVGLILQEPGMPHGIVLPWACQAIVSCQEFLTLEPDFQKNLPENELPLSEVIPNATSLVLPAADADRLRSNPKLRELLESGARLCLVVDEDLRPWHETLKLSHRIIVEPSLAGAICLLLDPPEGGIWVIP
jgi:hypothetical protein